jgi:hypothetical protein
VKACRWAALATLGLLGCATARPVSPAEAYAEALEAGQLDEAYALTTPSFQSQVSEQQFRVRFSDVAARTARAAAVRQGLAELAQSAPELFGIDRTEVPEAVILRFVSAVQAEHFDEAWHCLSAALRQRYSVEGLSKDFQAEPAAAARLERAVQAAEGIPVRTGDSLRFPIASGGAVVVIHERDGWRLEALE